MDYRWYRSILNGARRHSANLVYCPPNFHLARHATAAQLENLVRAYRRVGRLEECARATVQHASRELTYYYDDDGSLVIRVRLPADEGAVVLQALNAAMDAQQCDTQSDDVTAVTSRVEDRFAQRRADALTTLAVGFRAVVIAASSMRITSNTGQTAARRRSTISCYCAAVTTVWCTKADSVLTGSPTVAFVSRGPMAGPLTITPGFPAGPSPQCAAVISRPTRPSTHRRGSFQRMIWTTASQSADCCRYNKSGYRPRRQPLD